MNIFNITKGRYKWNLVYVLNGFIYLTFKLTFHFIYKFFKLKKYQFLEFKNF